MDALDLALLEGVRCGYFDPTIITALAAKLNKQFAALKLNSSFQQANVFPTPQSPVMQVTSGSGVERKRRISLSTSLMGTSASEGTARQL